ncbi:MAG: hypothetical protein V4539_07600 [Bacteroidota bacterium]
MFKKNQTENIAAIDPDKGQVKFTKKLEGCQNILKRAPAYGSAVLNDLEKTDASIAEIRNRSRSKRIMSMCQSMLFRSL